ncbi:MAG: diadenylate cyclase CdaA [Muribaculaceae bacterium]|nr:diadenylate cyclase CdaA [Muribaculaceae bacterium]
MLSFGIKDIIDIILVAIMLYYLYRIMKESGTINIFFGVLAFIVVWVVTSEILEMKMLGTILDKFMSIGLLILVIIFQDQLKRFLVELGSQKRWKFIKDIFHHKKSDAHEERHQWIMPIVYACMNMSKSKTGALIVIERNVPLESYEKTGDLINATINSRLIENIFFKNSPLHDGAMIIAHGKIVAAGCILPVSHDTNIPRSMGLRHRSALGISQATDAVAVVVSEETGNISIANRGKIITRLSSADLEHKLASLTVHDAE